MAQFEEEWRNARRHRIEGFKPFDLVDGQLWAPAYIKDRWRILELDPAIARDGALNVFSLIGNGGNVVPFIRAAFVKRPGAKAG